MKTIKKLDDLKEISRNELVKIFIKKNNIPFENYGILCEKEKSSVSDCSTIERSNFVNRFKKVDYIFDNETNSFVNMAETYLPLKNKYKKYSDKLANLEIK